MAHDLGLPAPGSPSSWTHDPCALSSFPDFKQLLKKKKSFPWFCFVLGRRVDLQWTGLLLPGFFNLLPISKISLSVWLP